ncbi:MAG: carbamoyltransferase HypF [Clostridiales bacterium]|nr:carbamoyltransferase HypF [Clostridiales bacterium]
MTERFTFYGLVQGLGFRPGAKRLAQEFGITGEIKNSGGSVSITATGEKKALDSFVRRLVELFDVYDYDKEIINDIHFDSFEIVPSAGGCGFVSITPDIATCAGCEKELFDSENRRYMHPFISCTACGPRYTIMKCLPYDRENTAMNDFEMCGECSGEYNETGNSRCFAQTIACNSCGPKLSMSIQQGVQILASGGVLAVKDIGGFHLACRADIPGAVNKIRQIKGRAKKPFAVMFSCIDEIRKYCHVNETEERLLTSGARPIVLLKKKKSLDKSVVSFSNYIGAFLPCNPVQLMLTRQVSPLVMTSANISGEVMVTDNAEAEKFGVPVLAHDRKILTPLDDSVVQVICKDKLQFIRRARGYVPLSFPVDVPPSSEILALGGDLKASFCFVKNSMAYMGGSFGDLEDLPSFEAYKKEISRFAAIHGFKTDSVTSDCHPAYYSAQLFGGGVKVQHHRAHAASVIAEYSLKGDVLSFVFDGTGYGDDGAVWGAEVFYFNGKSFERREHMAAVKMPATDEIAKNARLALSCYMKDNELLNKALDMGENTFSYTGAGRLFDAVAALLGICYYNSYESECATMLEHAAARATAEFELTPVFDPVQILNEIKSAAAAGAGADSIALGFHMMLVRLIVNTAVKYGIKQITLSGGVFVNRIITENAINELEKRGFSVYINEKVPPLDGGLALGQAYIALRNIQ